MRQGREGQGKFAATEPYFRLFFNGLLTRRICPSSTPEPCPPFLLFHRFTDLYNFLKFPLFFFFLFPCEEYLPRSHSHFLTLVLPLSPPLVILFFFFFFFLNFFLIRSFFLFFLFVIFSLRLLLLLFLPLLLLSPFLLFSSFHSTFSSLTSP